MDWTALAFKAEKKGCISMVQTGILNERTENIQVKYQMIVDNLARGNIHISNILTTEMVAEIMKKTLAVTLFEHRKRKLGIKL